MICSSQWNYFTATAYYTKAGSLGNRFRGFFSFIYDLLDPGFLSDKKVGNGLNKPQRSG